MVKTVDEEQVVVVSVVMEDKTSACLGSSYHTIEEASALIANHYNIKLSSSNFGA